eukprot:scaffold102669_cov64-Phaeocystis_antarctica.AAC.3
MDTADEVRAHHTAPCRYVHTAPHHASTRRIIPAAYCCNMPAHTCLMDMMDTADEVGAHGTMHHTAPHHASCIAPHRAASYCIVLHPILMDMVDTADEVRARS